MTGFPLPLLISVMQVRLGFVSVGIPPALPACAYLASFGGVVRKHRWDVSTHRARYRYGQGSVETRSPRCSMCLGDISPTLYEGALGFSHLTSMMDRVTPTHQLVYLPSV